MISRRKRGKVYWADATKGRAHVGRGSLGTRNPEFASRIIRKLEIAMAEGPYSRLWQELQVILPSSTYKRFSDISGVTAAPQLPTWAELHAAFSVFME